MQDMLGKIYDIIKDRQKSPKEGSYTTYLQTEGIDKICKKVGEEAAEVIIAAKNNDKKECIYEIADLFFHLLVLMHNQQISLEDIRNELKSRHK